MISQNRFLSNIFYILETFSWFYVVDIMIILLSHQAWQPSSIFLFRIFSASIANAFFAHISIRSTCKCFRQIVFFQVPHLFSYFSSIPLLCKYLVLCYFTFKFLSNLSNFQFLFVQFLLGVDFICPCSKTVRIYLEINNN